MTCLPRIFVSEDPFAGHNSLLIYGAGSIGRFCLDLLQKSEGERLVGFVDQDLAKRGLIQDGLPIYHLGDLEKMPDAVILVCVYSAWFPDIKAKLGPAPNRVFYYIHNWVRRFNPGLGRGGADFIKNLRAVYHQADAETHTLIEQLDISRNIKKQFLPFDAALQYEWGLARAYLDGFWFTAPGPVFSPGRLCFPILKDFLGRAERVGRVFFGDFGGLNAGLIQFPGRWGEPQAPGLTKAESSFLRRVLAGGNCFLKLDLRGAEALVLDELAGLISGSTPDLAVQMDDDRSLIEVPLALKALVPKYVFRLRGGGRPVCYASVRGPN